MDARRRLLSPALLVLALGSSACGGGGDQADQAGADPDPTTPTTVSAEAVTAAEETIRIDAAVRYAGFRLELEEAVVSDGIATITGRAENEGATSSMPPSNVTVALAAGELTLDPLHSELAEVPGGSTGAFAYGFRMDGGEDLDGAVLRIGGPDFARAEVPLGTDGDLVANEPVAVSVSGDVVAGETTFALSGGELRFDVPAEHEPAEAGKAFLTLSFAVTNNSSFAGGYAFAGEDLRLETPSGITLAPEEFPIELLAPNASVPDLFARWVVDADEPGTYTFVGLRNVGFDTQSEGRLSFEVPAP